MKQKISLIFFITILLTAAVLRLYKITEIPRSVNRDEASIGYTAYSLLLTGKDEYGQVLPLSFQSFGDWKLPFYIYTVVPFISLFGLQEAAVRLPSALFGIASVFATYFLIKKLTGNRILSLLTMALAAISPWSLHLSRVESESNTAVFFVILGALFFLHAIKDNAKFIIPSFFFFALTYYIYAGSHIFTTLFLLSLVILYWKHIPKTATTVIGVSIFSTLFFIIVYATFFQASKTKLSGISIFGDPAIVHADIEMPRNEHLSPQGLFARIVHNRVVFALERVSQNYLNAFSPQFLFISGGTNRAHNIEGFGNMYLVEAPFLLLGIFILATAKKSKEKYLIFFWLLLAPIAASITKDAPHTNRMFAIFPILQLFTAFGIYNTLQWLQKFGKLVHIGGTFAVSMLFLLNVFLYLDRYYIHFPRNEADRWGLGYKTLNTILSTAQFANKKVVITHPEYSPYIFLLFYSKYDPKRYQTEAVRYPATPDGFYHVRSFSRFAFRSIDWETDLKRSNTILVADPLEIPQDAKKNAAFIVSLPNGEIQFIGVETK